MILIKNDIKKILDKNALLMSLMALIFTSMTIFIENHDVQSINKIFDIVKIDGVLILYLMFVTELSKSTLVSDKINKKIEFLLANGVTEKRIIKKYIFSIYI